MEKLIFISNDDGYNAQGIIQLAEIARKFGDVCVVAPDGGRSGSSMSISSHTPVRNTFIKEEAAHDDKGSLIIWSCSGTPDDCTKMAFEKILPRTPDLVLSGINHGDNCAINAHYSGTMSVALEGCIKKVPSIAFSSGKLAANANFSYMEKHVESIIQMVLDNGLPLGVCLNVNTPDTENLKGIKVCKMGLGDWKEEWQERTHPHGGKYYWIAGYYEPYNKDDKDCDSWAYQNGYTAVAPIHIDMTAYEALDALRILEKTKR
ncbi:MAG: 5'/3'-nucleotidase SurE [Bacteroidaceae bacterium]|nr:5'/3'-nucleotidase SurE [Bacteroidaceae bacterium]